MLGKRLWGLMLLRREADFGVRSETRMGRFSPYPSLMIALNRPSSLPCRNAAVETPTNRTAAVNLTRSTETRKTYTPTRPHIPFPLTQRPISPNPLTPRAVES